MNFDFSTEERSRMDALDGILAGWGNSKDFETRSDCSSTKNRILQAASTLQDLPYISETGKAATSKAFAMACGQKLAAFSPSLHLSLDMGIRLPVELLRTVPADTASHACETELLQGKLLAAVAFREATMNIENDPITSRAEIIGDEIIIGGAKSWVINAPIADTLLVTGALGDKAGLFWIHVKTPGVTIGETLHPLGFDGTAVSHITFTECRIPKSAMIGAFDCKTLLRRIRLIENEILIASAVGLMKAAFEEARNHAKTHRSGGKPIIAYQEVGFKLSEMLTQLQTAELLAYRTAWSIENGAEDVESLLLCAKVFCAEAAEAVTGAALQILSGKGYFGQSVSERAYRCAKYAQIAGTSTEIARVRIGDEALGYR